MSDEFVEFDHLKDLPEILKRLGPVSGGDILVFRQDFFSPEQCQEISNGVMDYYAEIARARDEVHIKNALGDTKYTVQRESDRAAVHVPLIVFLPPGASLEHLTDSDMVRVGWQRIPPTEETTSGDQ
jgi:hypothetical protein